MDKFEPLEGEVFKDVARRDIKPDSYLVSNYGRVWSKLRHKFMKERLTALKYPTVDLQSRIKTDVGFIPAAKRVGKLVADHFLDKEKGCKFVFNIDGDRSNNHISNLKWVNSTVSTTKTKSKVYTKTTKISTIHRVEGEIVEKRISILDLKGFNPYFITEPITKKKTFSQFYLDKDEDWFLGSNAHQTHFEVLPYSDKAKRLEVYGKENKMKFVGSLGDCLATIKSLNKLIF